MTSRVFLIALALLAIAAISRAESSSEVTEATARAAFLEDLRNQIIWYDDARTAPLIIPEAVLVSGPLEELPVPDQVRSDIGAWIYMVRNWKSPAGQPLPDCISARRTIDKTPVPEVEKRDLTSVVEAGPVSLLVVVDKVVEGYWPHEGIYHFNQYSVLEVLRGSDFRNDPTKGGAFLSEGGEILVDGTRLCTLPMLYTEPPRRGELYLLIGAPDDRGVFHDHYYFRITNGQVDWADYQSLRKPAQFLTIADIKKALQPVEGFEVQHARCDDQSDHKGGWRSPIVELTERGEAP